MAFAHSPLPPHRRVLTLALVVAALVAACQPQPAANQPRPGEQASPDAGAVASPGAVETTLPEAMVDSDLEPEDQAALENLLDSEQLQAYLPSDLINDGGVILYQTLAMRDRPEAERPGQPVNVAATPGTMAPPTDWKRLDVERGGRQLTLRRQDGAMGVASKRARMVIKYPMRGVFAYRETERGTVVRKPFVQIFDRSFVFQQENNQWKLAQLSPVHLETQLGRSGLEINSFQVFQEGAEAPALSLSDRDRLVTPDEVPTLPAGAKIRLEVAVEQARDNGLFVYAYLAGKSDRSRQPLVDDGTQGDRVAGDGTYSGTFVVPATPGLRHFGVDVVDATSFQPGGRYRSNALGLSFRVTE